MAEDSVVELTPEEAARIFDSVLDNTATAARRDCVLANAAFAIRVICPEKEVAECLDEACESLLGEKPRRRSGNSWR